MLRPVACEGYQRQWQWQGLPVAGDLCAPGTVVLLMHTRSDGGDVWLVEWDGKAKRWTHSCSITLVSPPACKKTLNLKPYPPQTLPPSNPTPHP